MKKIVCILLIALLLLNAMGYYAIFLGLEFRNDSALTKTLDSDNYDDSRTVTLRIPVSLPYMTDQNEFERVDGKFAHNGEVYRMVKQKYSSDTLTIICYKDTESKRIQNALSDYVKTFTDKPIDQKSNAKIISFFIKDYIPSSFTIVHTSDGWQSDVVKNSSYADFTSSYMASIIHPPERA